MTDNVVPLRFNVEEVGKHVKSSKKRFTWDVSLGSKQHSIVLDFSFISGKVKVTVDRKILLENQLPANTSFQYPFTLDGNSLNVIQQGESFELRINNKVFSHLYNQMKTNKQFKKYEDQVKDFKVNESQFQAKKLTLNIGGVGGMKKKPKQQATEGHNWNAFGNDEMNGFPNYFQNQSVSTNGSTQKVEQPPKKINQKKINENLLEDSNLSSNIIKQQKFQNILDFETEIQNTPQQNIKTKSQDQFSTMQLMFQTMGMNPVSQLNKPSVIIDSNEVDFFSTTQQTKIPQKIGNPQQQPPIDLFAQVSKQSPNDFNTMRYMFNTNTPNGQNNLKQFTLDKSSVQKLQPGGLQLGWNGVNSGIMQSGLMQPGTVQFDEKNYSTLQGLFATNVMTGNQQVNVNKKQQNIKQESIQNNFSFNAQQFVTQQLPTQGFASSINVNPQSFGTQQFLNQGLGTSQLNFLNQQNNNFKKQPQQTIIQPQQAIIPPQQTLINAQPQINTNDFNSMQYLFKTNVNPIQQNNQQQFSIQSTQINMQKSQLSFNQQFSTTSGISTQSPNMMFMNTYGGSANGNLSFDMAFNQQQFATSANQQFATSVNQQFTSPINQQFTPTVNPSMMKKKAPQASSLGDLL